MVNQFRSDHDHGQIAVAFQHWIYGFTLQTIIYGINLVLFLMSIWVLGIHIFKGLHTNRFHRQHLLQNSILLAYAIGMFALSTVYMGHQSIVTEDAWTRFLQAKDPVKEIPFLVLRDRAALSKACTAVSVLINWGTVGILLWRCVIHWKIQSVFPSEVMALPYTVFALCIATSLLRLVQVSEPGVMSPGAMQRDWNLISWSVSIALYYLLSLLIVIRVVYHRRWIQKQVGEKANQFTSFLTIFNESSVFILIFSTAHLIILTKFKYLQYLSLAPAVQVQVMTSLIIVQRVIVGRAWSGKSIDCVLHQDPKPEMYKHEDLSAIGFNPNTDISLTENDYGSERSNNKEHDLTADLRPGVGPV